MLLACFRSNTLTMPMPMEAPQLATAPPAYLPVDVHAEILARLPSKSVLRFRCVCKAWRRITTDPAFLAAHARLQPAEVVLYRYLDSSSLRYRPIGYAVDIALEVIPVSGQEPAGRRRRRLIRYPKFVTTTDPPGMWHARMRMHCLLLGSCDGVLLFQKDTGPGSYLLCNPVTRQWAELPQLTVRVTEYAFYFHQPSGEFRLLCARREGVAGGGGETTWFVLSTGAAEPRHVEPHAAGGNSDLRVPSLLHSATTPPVALHGRLHWPPRRDTLTRADMEMEMVAFDTVSEKFDVMAGPRIIAADTTPAPMKLFAMNGLLVAANFGSSANHVDLWFLTNYGAAGRWERRHRVAAPWRYGWYDPQAAVAASDDRGNVMLGNHHGLAVYNVRTRKVRAVHYVATPSNDVLVSRHVFRESLVQHRGFQARSCADLSLSHFWR